MKLLNISYKFESYSSNDWSIDNLRLDNINLLVGMNATGKSRVMRLLKKFETIVKTGKINIADEGLTSSGYGKHRWDFEFENVNRDIIRYNFVTDDDIFDESVISESIFLNGEILLDRDAKKASLFSMKTKTMVEVNPPRNKLIFQIRRDEIEHPYLEDIAIWGEKLLNTEFIKNINQPFIEIVFKSLDDLSRRRVVDDMNKLGYNIQEISATEDSPSKNIKKYIYIKEKDLKDSLSDSELSQGMHRALRILISIEYLFKQKSYLLAIDDLGEGLDYERATKLGKLLVEKIENSNIQLIATSNDSFLMDVIPIKYWNILHREGNVVKSFNYQNSKELFDNFAFTGLSNFDLFSSDYLLQKT